MTNEETNQEVGVQGLIDVACADDHLPASQANDGCTPAEPQVLANDERRLVVLFYRAAKGHWWDKLIAWRTRSEYSHCEIMLCFQQRRDGQFVPDPGAWATCVSASPREGKVRVKEIQLDPGKWTAVSIPCTCKDVFPLPRFVAETINSRYDWPGIASIAISPLPGVQMPKWWFCSEWCATVIQRMGLGLRDRNAEDIAPGDLYRAMLRIKGARMFRL